MSDRTTDADVHVEDCHSTECPCYKQGVEDGERLGRMVRMAADNQTSKRVTDAYLTDLQRATHSDGWSAGYRAALHHIKTTIIDIEHSVITPDIEGAKPQARDRPPEEQTS